MPKPFGAEQGGLGTGKILCLHRKDLVPKPFGAEQGGLGTGKILCLNPLGLSKVV